MKGTFRSLRIYNYRLWAGGALVSNVGTWMQRTAQDWLVLTELTDHNATAVGIVMALQFGPMALLLPISGFAADHLDRRRLLITTQIVTGLLALILGVLTITGWVQLWHVYVLAGLLGCTSAIESPARQSFVSELVGEEELSNAVALNSTSFNAGRMLGPAAAGVLIAAVGTGWVFMINAASYVGVLVSLGMLRVHDLQLGQRAARRRGSFAEGFRYVWARPDLKAMLLMLFLIGTFGLNFPIFISTMAVQVFDVGASRYGLLTSMMAVGSVSGALLAARSEKPRMRALFAGTMIFGGGLGVAALMPNYWAFGVILVVVGMAAQTFTTSTNSLIQLSTEPTVRGRVLAIMLAITMGGTPIGAPMLGWVVDHFGARWAIAVGAASGFAAAAVALRYLFTYRGMRLHVEQGRLRLTFTGQPAPMDITPAAPPLPSDLPRGGVPRDLR